jgi:hypothetical protein
MKTFFTFVMSCASFLSFAAVLTVSNNPAITAQYSSAQTAYTAAAEGDELYLHGSLTTYVITMTNKKVLLTGPGFNPSGQNNLTAKISLTLQPSNENVLDGLVLNGLQVSSINNGLSNISIDQLSLYRCWLSGPITLNNATSSFTCFQCSVILTSGSASYTNGNFNNCLLADIQGFTNIYTNCLFTNCDLFVGIQGSIAVSLTGSTVVNSIVSGNYVGQTRGLFTSNSNSFTNTIFTRSQTEINGSNVNTFQNCLFQTNPQYVDGVIANAFTSFSTNSLLAQVDLRLAAGSPAINYGNDGTSVGITGGIAPFTNINTQGNSTLPKLNTFSLDGTTFPQNGTMQINFQATKQD